MRIRPTLERDIQWLPDVERSAAQELGRAVRAEVEGAIELDVPVEVGVGTGDTWYDAK